MDWLMIGSVVLNVLLAITLFFKGPLNELAKRLGLGWLDRRERQKELMRHLYGEVKGFAASYYTMVLYCQFAWDPKTKHMVTGDGGQLEKSIFDAYAEHHAFLEENSLLFPSQIRSLVKELMTEVRFSPRIGVDGLMQFDQAKMKESILKVAALSQTIREALEREA